VQQPLGRTPGIGHRFQGGDAGSGPVTHQLHREAQQLGLGGEVVAQRAHRRLGRAAREGFLWLLGLVGFFLLADALGHVQIIN
jgi:hypothetical protein